MQNPPSLEIFCFNKQNKTKKNRSIKIHSSKYLIQAKVDLENTTKLGYCVFMVKY